MEGKIMLKPFSMRNYLARITEALERLAPSIVPNYDLSVSTAFVWNATGFQLQPVNRVNTVDLSLLHGIDYVRDQLVDNTTRFAHRFPANNVLLWGARGTGKSSLVKAVHARISKDTPLKIVEIYREDIATLPQLMQALKSTPFQILLFCDDLSFDGQDSSYKALKTVLDGGLEGRPSNMLFYATSNRRHLMPRDMIENEASTAINPTEAVEEKVSLSDRFGLWLGFHSTSQNDYLAIVKGYADFYQLPVSAEDLRAHAIEWAATRGSRSGRVAWQFIQHLAGMLDVKI
jgi:predicted AAA+ superfamily ATPase